MSNVIGARPPAWIRLVAVLALLWNLIGIAFYLGQVGLLGGAFAPPTASADLPAWVTGAWAVAVFGGATGALGLALLARWSRPLLWIALAAAILNWGWVFLASDAGVEPLGLVVLVVAAGLVWLATIAANRHWLG
jgi:hypothetical protein